MLSAEQMRSLADVLRTITDPRSRYGRRYRLETLLALAAAATLCGARGYKAIHEWVCDLSPAMLRHFRCRRVNGAYERSEHLLSAQRDRAVAPGDGALRAWFVAHGHDDASRHRRQDHEGSRRPSQVHILGAAAMRRHPLGPKKTVLTGDDGTNERCDPVARPTRRPPGPSPPMLLLTQSAIGITPTTCSLPRTTRRPARGHPALVP